MEPPAKEVLLQNAFSFLRDQGMGCIASVDQDNIPEVACVNYLLDDDWTIYILTQKDSRKAQNIRQNPHIAFAVGVANVPNTAQFQADATILEDSNPDFTVSFQKLKDSKRLDRDPMYDMYGSNYVVLKLKITWFRWLYFDKDTGKEVYTVLIP